MGFILEERQALLELKGVGPVVIQRFEEIEYRPSQICVSTPSLISQIGLPTCWETVAGKTAPNPKERFKQRST